MKNNNITKHPLYEKLLKEFHPTKNGNLKLSDFSYGSKAKVWWKCYNTEHNDHEWKATIDNRATKGHGCSCCDGRTVVLSNCLSTINSALATQLHPTKNGNLTAYDITAKSYKKLWWLCDKFPDHEWQTRVSDRANGKSVCPCCSGQKVVLSNCLSTTHFELAKQLHPTKNGELNAFNVNAGSNKKMHWICEKGHEWAAIIASRTRGNGCRICDESHGEKAITTFLDKMSVIYERQKKYNDCSNKLSLPFDFYLPKYNILIEYDGIQHFKSKEYFGGEKALIYTKQNDSIKTKFASNNNIPLLRIPYTEFDNIEAILISFIMKFNVLTILPMKTQ